MLKERRGLRGKEVLGFILTVRVKADDNMQRSLHKGNTRISIQLARLNDYAVSSRI